jgi:hypothetical protein
MNNFIKSSLIPRLVGLLVLPTVFLWAQGSTPTRFNLEGYNDLRLIPTPSGVPDASHHRFYAKTASTVCIKTHAGAETCFGIGGLVSLNGLTGAIQTFATPGSAGTAPAWSSAGTQHTLNIPMASTTSVTAGLLSKARYDLFNTRSKDINVLSPTTAETNLVQEKFPSAVTITRVSCSLDSGTSVVIQFDERAEATPNTAGTNVLTGNLTCDTTNGGITTSFTNAGIAANAPLNLQVISSTGNPNAVRIHVQYTID